MKAGSTISLPLRLVDATNPLLIRGEPWLLRNAPTFWRTSVLKIIWYLFLGHLLLWLIGSWTASNLKTIPTLQELMVFEIWTWPTAAVIALGWIASVWNMQLIDRRLSRRAITLLIYTGFFYGLVTLPNAYFAPVSGAVAKLYDAKNYLAVDRSIVKGWVLDICGERPPREDGQDLVKVIERVYVGRQDLQHIDFAVRMLIAQKRSACKYVETRGQRDELDISKLSVEHILRDVYLRPELFVADQINSYPARQELERGIAQISISSRLDAVKISNQFSAQEGSIRYFDALLSLPAFILAACLGFLLLAVEAARPYMSRFMDAAARLRNTLGIGTRRTHAMDRFLLRRAPKLWVMQLHIGLGLALFLLGAGYLMADITNLTIVISGFSLYLYLVYPLLVFWFSVFLMDYQIRYFEMGRLVHGASIRFFAAVFLPPYVVACILFILPDKEQDPEVTAIAIASLAYVAASSYWAATFAGSRMAISTGGIAIVVAPAIILGMNYFQTYKITYVFLTLLLLIYFFIWPARQLGILNWIRSEWAIALLVFGGTFVPFLFLMAFNIMKHGYFVGEAETNRLFLIFGYLLTVVLIVPLLTRMQRLCIEPQEV